MFNLLGKVCDEPLIFDYDHQDQNQTQLENICTFCNLPLKEKQVPQQNKPHNCIRALKKRMVILEEETERIRRENIEKINDLQAECVSNQESNIKLIEIKDSILKLSFKNREPSTQVSNPRITDQIPQKILNSEDDQVNDEDYEEYKENLPESILTQVIQIRSRSRVRCLDQHSFSHTLETQSMTCFLCKANSNFPGLSCKKCHFDLCGNCLNEKINQIQFEHYIHRNDNNQKREQLNNNNQNINDSSNTSATTNNSRAPTDISDSNQFVNEINQNYLREQEEYRQLQLYFQQDQQIQKEIYEKNKQKHLSKNNNQSQNENPINKIEVKCDQCKDRLFFEVQSSFLLNSVTCDICKVKPSNNSCEYSMRCHHCDYDVCQKCFEKRYERQVNQ